MYRSLLFCFVSVIGLLSSVRTFAQTSPAPGPTPADSLVHYGDVVDVDFVGSIEYDWRGGVSPEGDLLGLDAVGGKIAAVCRSESEIAADIEKIYGKLLRAPQVRVRIIDRSNRAVAVLDGAVKTPTRFRISRVVRLRELIVLAGGFTDAASGGIRILRPLDLNCSVANSPKSNTSEVTTIKISNLLAGDAASNIQVLSGDTIEVERGEPVYVIGAVANPRPVYLRPEMTISRAIATAGGLAKDASGKAIVFRQQKGRDPAITEVDLGKVKRGETVDFALMPFDIIDVAGKGSQKRRFPPITSSNDLSGKRELPLRVID